MAERATSHAGVRLSLASKVALLSVACAGVLAVTLTYRSYLLATAALRSEAESAMRADARQVASYVDVWNAQRLHDLEALAKLGSVARLLESHGKASEADLQSATDALDTLAEATSDVESIALVDAEGNILLNTNAEDAKSGVKSLKVRDYFQEAMKGNPFITGVTISLLSHQPSLFHSVPVRRTDGAIVGVVRSRSSLSGVVSAVQAANDRAGEGAGGILVDSDGLVIATGFASDWLLRPLAPLGSERLSALRAEKRWGGEAPPEPLAEKELLQSLHRGDEGRRGEGFFAWVNASKTAYHALSIPLKRTPWSYVAALPARSFEGPADDLERTGLIWAVLGLVITALAAVLFARRMTQPVVELTAATSRIVTEGDLTQRINVSSGDEVGALASTFSQMVDRLRELPQALHASSDLLISASTRLDEAAGEQSKVLSRQAAALQETQVTAQELKQTAQVAAEKAKAVLDFAERADELGHKGQNAIEQSLHGLEGIREHVYEVSKRIAQLEGRTQQIGSITATVKDLADQSNMLALNAAIEAVRSGEHGKGFGVVAREIRSLADQSIAATKRVGEILEEITVAIRQTVSFAEDGTKRMEGGVQSVRASGESLNELSSIVRNNVGAVRQIASAVAQQSAGISQIFSAVSDQSSLMAENQNRMEQTSTAARELLGASKQVQGISSRYKV